MSTIKYPNIMLEIPLFMFAFFSLARFLCDDFMLLAFKHHLNRQLKSPVAVSLFKHPKNKKRDAMSVSFV